MNRRFLHRFAYLALFAVLLAALAPSVSYALAAGKGETVVEMCTSFGIEKVKVPQDADTDDHSSGGPGSQHCSFCLFAHAAIPVPAPLPALEPAAAVDAAIARAEPPLVHDLSRSWFAIRSHAPPGLS